MLPKGAVIATSSERREAAVRELRPGFSFTFRDVRGTIGQRLALLDKGEADGVVIAEAALIRLGLTHLNRITLPGTTTEMQGQLAIIARQEDNEMRELFSPLDCRPKILYTGLELPPHYYLKRVVHCPLIEVKARPKTEKGIVQVLNGFGSYSHLIFTSKSAASIFVDYAISFGLGLEAFKSKTVIAVGQATGRRLRTLGLVPNLIAEEETAEGVVDLMAGCGLRKESDKVLWPHAAQARPVIANWLKDQAIPYDECILYDTLTRHPEVTPDLNHFDEVVFTSPSTVEAFKTLYGAIPKTSNLKFTPIGPITKKFLG
jgi:hydroxymethylbilane synthase